MTGSEVVDSRFLASMAGREAFLRRMFAVFIAQEPKRIEQIRQALEQGDAEGLRHLAHALKGGAATMGVGGVRDCCQRLEQASRDQDLAAARRHVDDLESEMRLAYSFMFHYLAEHQA